MPDFEEAAIWRGFAQGEKRLVGVINLDQEVDTYYRLSVSDLPADKTAYQLIDVAEQRLISSGPKTTFTAAQLAAGVVLRTPARYGVSLYMIAPEGESLPQHLDPMAAMDLERAYQAYREPNTTGAVLAEGDGLSLRYDMVGEDNAKAVLIESPLQQVWVRLQSGGRVSDWKIKDGDRTVVWWVPPYGGAAADLFWTPADAHWAGDELSAYQLVDAKVHDSKAYLRLRQKKQTPSLQGLVVTKTIVVPADRTDIEVQVEIENQGPAPEIGIAPWAHHEFIFGLPELAKSTPRVHPQIFLQTVAGTREAPLVYAVVWAKPGAGYLPGNESFESSQRNGETTGDWIAQRNPATGEAVLCQVDSPSVAQFYSWRDPNNADGLSVEWMYPYLRLPAGQKWETSYVLRYLKSVKPEGLEGHLLKGIDRR